MSTWLTGRPFYITAPDTGRRVPVVWLHKDGPGWTARWTIGGQEQRMHKYSAIPKDLKIWQDIIKPYCHRIEVLDKTEELVYSISVEEFDQHKWLLTTKAGPQWAVDRHYWTQTGGQHEDCP